MSKRKRLYDIIEIGNKSDFASYAFDIFIVLVIALNLIATLADTFEECLPYKSAIYAIEIVTVVIFTAEYILRLWTAAEKYTDMPAWKAAIRFIFSFYGIIDLLTFLPFYIPFMFPMGIVAFRILRVFRIFRLFRINAQYDAFNVITNVLYEKKNQLISSMCLILILMVASSLGMYGLEHDAQPDAYRNAFSGIWWSVSTLLTVGYGDIYPITTAGKVLAIITAFMGVGMVAVPTGILSAGFVEQYTRVKSEAAPDDGIGDIADCKYCPWRLEYIKEHQSPSESKQ